MSPEIENDDMTNDLNELPPEEFPIVNENLFQVGDIYEVTDL
jgi:hypothetical protein